MNDSAGYSMRLSGSHSLPSSLWNLRGQTVDRLLEKVDFQTDNMDATGNEFEASLQSQAMLESYMAAYTDALADRREMLTEGVSL
jgi:hypothetical protein